MTDPYSHLLSEFTNPSSKNIADTHIHLYTIHVFVNEYDNHLRKNLMFYINMCFRILYREISYFFKISFFYIFFLLIYIFQFLKNVHASGDY